MNLVGTRIGSYIVERELGSGGAGTVYACRHTMIDREVAVKVLHDEHVRDPDQVARFFQEAKAAADIGHPNIIVIIDYGTIEVDGLARTYVMMESLDGESLDKRMQRGGLTVEDILHIFSQVASALIACHGKGIIHRDLKPSNILVADDDGTPQEDPRAELVRQLLVYKQFRDAADQDRIAQLSVEITYTGARSKSATWSAASTGSRSRPRTTGRG